MDTELECYCIALVLVVFFIFHSCLKTNKNLPPSPPSLPILGHLHYLKQPFHRFLNTLSDHYGPILYLRFGQQPVLVVSSPLATQQCLTQSDIIFANRPRFMVGELLGYNYSVMVWAPYGSHWRDVRRICTIAALSSHQIQQTCHVREGEVRYMIRKLCGLTPKVNLNALVSELTNNLVMRMVNGKQWDGAKELFRLSYSLMNECDFLPVLRWVGYKGLEKNFVDMKKRRDVFLQGLIDECRREKAESLSSDKCEGKSEEGGGGKRKTMLQQLLAAQEAEPEHYTDEVLKGILLVMLAAGTETSARTIEWAMSLLLSNSEVFHKARTEIDAVIKNCRLVDDSDIGKLNYLHCVINETLRLFPVAPLLIPHFSSGECVIEGYRVPKGTVLLVNVWAIHRSPSVWKDPEDFKPERFMEAQASDGEGFKFLPFGMGRRACPGANLAMRMVTLTLATLIQCFDWERAEGGLVDLAEGSGITIQKLKPLEAVCTPRSSMSSIISQL
ncbi:hypothetical protein Ancab_016464 [Ancistrocladus abbreviatus]